MLVIGSAIIGALLGGFTAKRNGGNTADIAQYAAAGGIALAILGMIATVIIHRSLV